MKQTLVVSAEDARDIIFNDHKEFSVIENEILENSRWEIHHRVVVEHNESERFYEVYYSEGATEQQDGIPFEYDDEVELVEVFPIEEVRIVYK